MSTSILTTAHTNHLHAITQCVCSTRVDSLRREGEMTERGQSGRAAIGLPEQRAHLELVIWDLSYIYFICCPVLPVRAI